MRSLWSSPYAAVTGRLLSAMSGVELLSELLDALAVTYFDAGTAG